MNLNGLLPWALLVLGFILSCASAVISFSEKKKDFISKKNPSKFFFWTFGIALLGAIAALISGSNSIIEKNKSAERNRILNDSIKGLVSSLIEVQRLNTDLLLQQKDSTEKIITTQSQLIESDMNLFIANKKIQSLQDTVIQNIMGAGNMPHLTLAHSTSTKNFYILRFMLQNIGTTPLRDIYVRITDIYAGTIFEKMPDGTTKVSKEGAPDNDEDGLFSSLMNTIKEINLGSLPPMSYKDIYFAKMPKNPGEFGYRLELSWDNGTIDYEFGGRTLYGAETPMLWLRSAKDHFRKDIPNKFINVTNWPDPVNDVFKRNQVKQEINK